jgi:hypothetical protein
MKKSLFLLLFLFLGASPVLYAQKNETTTLPSLTKILLKGSVGGLAEYATCLHLSIETRPFTHFGFQPEIGYYSDFLRNKSYNLNTSSFNGLRLGGELRYYFTQDNSQQIQTFLGLSCITNISKVRNSAGALILQNGKIVLVETPIAYQHQRTFYDIVTGVQAFVNTRFFIDASFGFGIVSREVSNIKVFDKQATLYNAYYPLQILFPSNSLWTSSSHLDRGDFINIAANIKIGYRLF